MHLQTLAHLVGALLLSPAQQQRASLDRPLRPGGALSDHTATCPTTTAPRPTNALVRLALAVLTTLALVFPAATPAQAQDLKVGVVDFGRAIQETEGKKAIAKFEKAVSSRKGELKKLEDDIVKLEKDIKQNMAILSDEKKKEQLMNYQKKAYDYQRLAVQYEQEMNQERAKVLGRIQDKMQKISVEIAQEKGLDLMIERNEGAIIYFKGSFDLTDELIKRYKK